MIHYSATIVNRYTIKITSNTTPCNMFVRPVASIVLEKVLKG